jgi:hypothetical protein
VGFFLQRLATSDGLRQTGPLADMLPEQRPGRTDHFSADQGIKHDPAVIHTADGSKIPIPCPGAGERFPSFRRSGRGPRQAEKSS